MLDPKLLNFLFIRTGDELDFVCMKDILEIWEGEKKRKKDINEAIGSTFDVGFRVAHFPAGKRETGNGYREISRREMAVFPGNFPVLTKIGLKWAKNGQNLTNLAS